MKPSTLSSNSNSDQERELHLDPNRDADKIIQSGKWRPFVYKIINNGKWKSYYYNGKLVSYTFKEAAEIEEHQKLVTEESLGELHEKFKPLLQLNDEEKKQNENR